MDGNRRWAKKNGLDKIKGHQEGKESVKEVLKASRELGIKHLTLWAMSLDNIKKRSKREVKNIMNLFKKGFKEMIDHEEVHKNEVRVNVYGRWKEYLPEDVKKPIKKVIENTKDYNKRYLNFLISYSGTDEMLQAIKNIVKKDRNKDKDIEIDRKTVKENLFTSDLPPVDLMIRTGGEPHNSNGFMMWHIANSQYYFTDKLWPEFDKSEFKKAVEDYQSRGRRFGK